METELKNFHNSHHLNSQSDIELVKRMTKTKCKFMETGLKKEEMEFYYCDCDPNKDSPICIECAKSCHENHKLSPIQKDFQICSCGLKNHFLNDNKNQEYSYQNSCFFNEFAANSNSFLDFYYDNREAFKICIFCYFFCRSDSPEEFKGKEFKKTDIKTLENKNNNLPCNCPNEKHSDINNIFIKLNYLCEDNFSEEFGISPQKIFNLIFLCNKFFHNIYNNFINTSNSIRSTDALNKNSATSKENSEIQNKILNSNFFRSIKNFYLWGKKIKYIYYFNHQAQFYLDVDVIKFLLDTKIEQNKNAYTAMDYILTYFQKVHLGTFFSSHQNFKVKDFQNISPWQRITMIWNFRLEKIAICDIKNGTFQHRDFEFSNIISFIEILLNAFTNFNTNIYNISFGLCFAVRISSIIKKFAKFYLISFENMIRYTKIVEKTLKNLYIWEIRSKEILQNKNMKSNKELIKLSETKSNINPLGKEENFTFLKLLLIKNVLKTFFYFSFAKNDGVIAKFFGNININDISNNNNELDIRNHPHNSNSFKDILSKEEFIFSNCELGIEINRNLVDIMEIMKNELFDKDTKVLRKIHSYANDLMMIMLIKDDWYIENFKLTKDQDYFNKLSIFHKGERNDSEKTNFDNLVKMRRELEKTYADHYDNKLKLSDFIKLIGENVTNFNLNVGNNISLPKLDEIGINNEEENKFFRHSSTKNIIGRDIKKSMRQNSNNGENLLKILSISSNYINSLLKFFHIIKSELKISSNKQDTKLITWERVANILKLLYFVANNSPENCLMILTNQNLYNLSKFPLEYIHKLLEFYIHCLNILIENSYNLINMKIISKEIIYIFNIVYESDVSEDLKSTIIYKVFVILKLLSLFESKDMDENREFLRGKLKEIFAKYLSINFYKHDLLKISEGIIPVFNNNEIGINISKEDKNEKNFLPIMVQNFKYKQFVIFISLINDYFDENALRASDISLENILNLDEILQIIKIENLSLDLRTEILKYFRMMYIDVYIQHDKLIDYRNVITKDHQNLDDRVKKDRLEIFNFYEKIIFISDHDDRNFDKEFEIFIYETLNFQANLSANLSADKQEILNYFENGLILPLKIFLNKMFSRMNKLTGIETIKIYELVYRLLLIKKYIIESNLLNEIDYRLNSMSESMKNSLKINTPKIENKNKENLLNNNEELNQVNKKNSEGKAKEEEKKKISMKTKSSVKFSKLNNSALIKIKKDIQKITDKHFKIMDLSAIYQIITEHLENIIEKPSSAYLIEKFEDINKGENEVVEYFLNELISTEDSNNRSSFTEKFTYFTAFYRFKKFQVDYLGFQNISSENHSIHEVSYQSLILKYCFYILQNNSKFYYNEIVQSALIILNFLQKDTNSTQKEILQFLQSNSSIIDLKAIIEFWFKNFISILLSQFNPAQVSITDEYFICFVIIKIFKFFCEEHNQEFQEILLSRLSFKITDNKKIMFYDMMLMILDKIAFISQWSKTDISDKDEIDQYSALFSSVTDLLIEVIQGTKKENFSLLHRKSNLKHSDYELDESFENHPKGDDHSHKNKHGKDHNSNGHNIKHGNERHGSGHHGNESYKKHGNHHKISHVSVNKEDEFQAANMLRSYYDPTIESGKSLEIFMINIKPILFNFNANNESLYKIRKLIANFILAFIEECSCPENIKHMIISHLPSTFILKSISCALKKYYLKHVDSSKNGITFNIRYTLANSDTFVHRRSNLDNSQQTKNNMINNRKNILDGSKNINNIYNQESNHNDDNVIMRTTSKKMRKKEKTLKFSEKICSYFHLLYFNDADFPQTNEFDFSVSLYTYFKLNILNKTSEECLALWNKLHGLSPESLNEFNIRAEDVSFNKEYEKKSSNYEENDFEYFYVIKFFEIICKNVSIRLEDNTKTVIVFLISPTINYLSVNSKKEFERSVNRDSRYSKLYSLILQTEYFLEEIKFNSDDNFSRLLKFMNRIDYQFIGTLVFMLSFIINVSLVAILEDGGESYFGYDSLNIIKYVTISIVLFNFVFIILWITSKLPLYIKIETIKLNNKLKLDGKEDINVVSKTFLLIDSCFIQKNEINLLFWIFICMLVGEVMKKNSFAYSVSLLAVVNLSQVFNNIFLSVTLKWKSLGWTMLFTFIIMYVFAAWGFFYEQDRFNWAKIHNENTCSTLFYCFLTVSNIGLRNRAGIGLILSTRSFYHNPSKFVERTFYDVIFFILIVIMMLKIIFGIILDTFRMLREKEFKTERDIMNKCFICHVDKDNLEKNSINFEEHCTIDHNIWDYAYYIITLRLKDAQDLNANNSYVKEEIDKKSICWFPTSEFENEEEEEEEHHH